jgi:hypothetical protein
MARVFVRLHHDTGENIEDSMDEDAHPMILWGRVKFLKRGHCCRDHFLVPSESVSRLRMLVLDLRGCASRKIPPTRSRASIPFEAIQDCARSFALRDDR